MCSVRLPFCLSVGPCVVCQCSFVKLVFVSYFFSTLLLLSIFIFLSLMPNCWPILSFFSFVFFILFFSSQHSRVLFNFSTDHVSLCHKTPNLFCRLCFYKQTLIIIMWQFNTLFFSLHIFTKYVFFVLLLYTFLFMHGCAKVLCIAIASRYSVRREIACMNDSTMSFCHLLILNMNFLCALLFFRSVLTKVKRHEFYSVSLRFWLIYIIHAYEIFMKITNW